MLKIEYMIYKDKKESFANDVVSIKNLILIDSDIKKESDSFSYDELMFEVEINLIPSLDGKNNYFDFTLTYSGRVSDKAANKLTSLHRKIISIFKGNFTSAPKVLWSDLDSYYSTKAYPLIKEVENLMRKVLTKLLIVKVGYSWEKSSVSADLKGKAGSSKGRNIESNYLSALDFIDLTQIIFDKYSPVHRDVIFEEIEKACENDDVNRALDVLPRSNWQKYLSGFFNCKEDILIAKWSQLYEIRCAIAHNTGFTKGDFDKCVELTKSITQTLTDSLRNINNSSVEDQVAAEISDTGQDSHSRKSEEEIITGPSHEKYNDLKELQVSIERMSNPVPSDLRLIEKSNLYGKIGSMDLPGLVSQNSAFKAIMDAASNSTMEKIRKHTELMRTVTAAANRYDSLMKTASQAGYYDALMKNIPIVNNYEDILKNMPLRNINGQNENDEPTDDDN